MPKRRLAIVLLYVFVDLLGYSLFLPILPYYARSLGAGPTLIGLLVASNAVAQLFAGPIFGRLSDRHGRRPLLIVAVAGTLVSFVLLGLATTVLMLFISRTLDGLLGGNVTLARAYITDITDEENRARGLGLIGAVFGLGFIIGPALGGTLANLTVLTEPIVALGLSRYAVPALAATALAVINLVLIIFWLPESLPEAERGEASDQRRRLSLAALQEVLRRPCVGPLLTTRFFYRLAFSLFASNFALYTLYRLGLSDRSTSYILTYVGVLIVFVQGVAIGRLTDRFGERLLILAGLVILTVALFAWALVPNVPLLLAVLAPLALSSGTLNTSMNSYLTKAVQREDVGGTLGISSSLESLARAIAPAVGGPMVAVLGAASLGLAGGGIMMILVLFAWQTIASLPDLPGSACREDEPTAEPT